MSGIYFHIPFCKSKCNYCDFYSRRDSKGIGELIYSEIAELNLRKEYIDNEDVSTIYFGGGTPSLLSIDQINNLLNTVRQLFVISDGCEITFEANPEDLTEEYLFRLFQLGINRLSIGMQSFNNETLNFLGRRHDSSRAYYIIETAKNAGFENISIDLIFGIPGMSYANYTSSLNEVINLNIQHVSAYLLTIEENTYLYKLFKNNKLCDISENDLLNQFNATIDILSENGFFQYEISNYAKPGFISRHNSSYWDDIPYLGIGPSSHSYNKISRQWNISDTLKYCNCINQSKIFYEVEMLSEIDKFNEYILKGLRTAKGISKRYISENFNEEICFNFINNVNNILKGDLIILDDETITLTRKGIFLSDFVIRALHFI